MSIVFIDRLVECTSKNNFDLYMENCIYEDSENLTINILKSEGATQIKYFQEVGTSGYNGNRYLLDHFKWNTYI